MNGPETARYIIERERPDGHWYPTYWTNGVCGSASHEPAQVSKQTANKALAEAEAIHPEVNYRIKEVSQ